MLTIFDVPVEADLSLISDLFPLPHLASLSTIPHCDSQNVTDGDGLSADQIEAAMTLCSAKALEIAAALKQSM